MMFFFFSSRRRHTSCALVTGVQTCALTISDGWELIEMDLSQIELRIAAELADEHNLLRVFNSGGDPHWQTAIREIERGAGYKKEMRQTVKFHHELEGKEYVKMSYSEAIEYEIGRAHVCTPVTNAHLVCRLLLEKKKNKKYKSPKQNTLTNIQ